LLHGVIECDFKAFFKVFLEVYESNWYLDTIILGLEQKIENAEAIHSNQTAMAETP